MEDIQHLLAKLIDIPSVTGNENKIARFLRDYLADKGMTAELVPVSGERCNVYACFSDNPAVILTTHMDTVAPFIPPRIEKGTVYGRGACDAKGIIAAMIHAAMGLEQSRQKETGLLFVIGEEVDSIGAKEAAQGNIRPRFFINGEPTENKLVHAQKGTCLFQVKARGKATHSGYPQYGSSAINKLIDYLEMIRRYKWPKNELGETLVNVGKIAGGEALNTLASSATAECSIRIVTSAKDVTDTLHNLLIEDIDLDIYSASDPVKLFCPEEIKETIHVNYGSDVFYLQAAAKVLMLGPGTILNAHTENEHILISELMEAVDKYRELVRILVKYH